MHSIEKRLFLIPSSLGGSELNRVIPDYNLSIIQGLNHFVVEEERTARRFLIGCGLKKNISEIKFHILNEHTPATEIPVIFKETGGEDLGLLSEAGLPAVADPGALLVREAHRMNARVIPLIGPSSLMLALMSSGLNGQNFAFCGYLPVKQNERYMKIRYFEKRSETENQSLIFIEAPYRNNQLAEAFLAVLKPTTSMCVAMNLTLPDEWIQTRTVSEWKRYPPPDLHKKPAVFVIQA